MCCMLQSCVRPTNASRVQTGVRAIRVAGNLFVFVKGANAAQEGAAREVEGGGNRNIRLMADVLHFGHQTEFKMGILMIG